MVVDFGLLVPYCPLWWCCVGSSHSFFRPLQVYNMEIGPFCVHRGCYRGEREKGVHTLFVSAAAQVAPRSPHRSIRHSVLGWYHAGQHNRTLALSVFKGQITSTFKERTARDIPKPELSTSDFYSTGTHLPPLSSCRKTVASAETVAASPPSPSSDASSTASRSPGA